MHAHSTLLCILVCDTLGSGGEENSQDRDFSGGYNAPTHLFTTIEIPVASTMRLCTYLR